MSPLTAFLTGLTTGGLTCMAVQGALLAGILAQQRSRTTGAWKWSSAIGPVVGFLVAKLIAYMLLGGLLGWLGSRVQLSVTARIWFQAAAAVFIIIAGIRIRWPGFLPWLTPQLPVGIRRFVRRSARWESLAAPVALGFLTILIPCGTTQAMEVAAIAAGHAATGAAILGAFVLGTAPLFLVVGIAAKGVNLFQHRLAWVAATAVIVVGLFSLNGVLVSIDSPLAFQRVAVAFHDRLSGESGAVSELAVETLDITVHSNGYTPNTATVPAGKVVTINLTTDHNAGCTSVFRIPKLGVTKDLPATGSTTLTAQFPSPGVYTFTCGMGMYTGTITAV